MRNRLVFLMLALMLVVGTGMTRTAVDWKAGHSVTLPWDGVRARYLCEACEIAPVFVIGLNEWWYNHRYYEPEVSDPDSSCYGSQASEFCNFCDTDPQGCHEGWVLTQDDECPSDACIDGSLLLASLIDPAVREGDVAAVGALLERYPDNLEWNRTRRRIDVRGCDGKVVVQFDLSKPLNAALVRLAARRSARPG